jgi:peroxiredoxin
MKAVGPTEQGQIDQHLIRFPVLSDSQLTICPRYQVEGYSVGDC